MPITFEDCMAAPSGVTLLNPTAESLAARDAGKSLICSQIMSATSPEQLDAIAESVRLQYPEMAGIALRRAAELRGSPDPLDRAVSAVEQATQPGIQQSSVLQRAGLQSNVLNNVAGDKPMSGWAWAGIILGGALVLGGGGYAAYRYATGRKHNPVEGATVSGEDGEFFMPDVRIRRDKPEFVYRPLRGFSALLAVFDLNDRCIGWISTEVLGYPDVASWMRGTRYIARKSNPAPFKYNAKKNNYKYFVVSARRDTGRAVITSGNEYREDAKDAMDDLPPSAPDEDRRIYTKPALVRMGLDPDNNDNWGNP